MEKRNEYVGRPVSALPGEERGQVLVTAAPEKNGGERQDGTLRLIRYRDGCWTAARFLDGLPKRKET